MRPPTLDEALCDLGGRELITSEMEAPRADGPTFERYGIAVDAE